MSKLLINPSLLLKVAFELGKALLNTSMLPVVEKALLLLMLSLLLLTTAGEIAKLLEKLASPTPFTLEEALEKLNKSSRDP